MNETIQTVKGVRDRVPAEDVAEISSGDYNPNGCTPLHDAMGFGITALDKAAGKDDVVLATIITDPDIKFGIKFGHKNIGWNGKFYTFPYFLTFLPKRFLKERPFPKTSID